MSLWRQIRFGWRGVRARAGRDQELTEELTHFYEQAESDWIERGLSPEEARGAVRREAGSMSKARERAMEYGWENNVLAFWSDLRFSLEQLAKRRAFTVTAVLTLALGIGANSAIFTIVDHTLLSPLPYRNPNRLVLLETHRDEIDKTISRVTGPDAADVRNQARTLQAVSLYSGGTLGVQLRDHAAYAMVTLADENFARVFELRPIAGRLFSDGDASRAVLVSEFFARDNFGGPQDAVGKVIRIDGQPAEIVGVLGSGFDYPDKTQIWMAAPLDPLSKSRTAYNYKAVGLLQKGQSLAAAQGELDVISSRLRTSYAKDNRGKTFHLQLLQEALTSGSRSTLLFLWASATLILLIACVNIMHLELVRSMERQRELAIRRAMGAPSWRMMQPVFCESLLLALAGGLAGVMLAFPLVRLLVAIAPEGLPSAGEVHLDIRVLAFTLALSAFAAIVSAMLPAIRAARIDPIEALKSDSSRGLTQRDATRFRTGLVIAEVAATFVLAVGAGLLVRTMVALDARNMGFETRRMLVIDADAPAQGTAEALKAVQHFDTLFAKLRQLPGVQHVAGIMGLPAGSYGSNGNYETRGGLPANTAHPEWSTFSVASPAYFSTMGIPLSSGRDFAPSDTSESNMVAVISQALARQSFGKADPLGKQIRCGLDTDKWMTIVGVVGDVRQDSPADTPGPTLYMPMSQHSTYANQLHVVLRTSTQPASLVNAVDATIKQVDPFIARTYTTMDALESSSTSVQYFRAALMMSFAGIGLLLAVLGVYGTVAYSVAQRRFEFGIRLAFGAPQGDILRMVLGSALRMASAGIVLGLVASVSLGRLLESMLVGVLPGDPVTLCLVSLVLLIAALGAAWRPSRAATLVCPMEAMRSE